MRRETAGRTQTRSKNKVAEKKKGAGKNTLKTSTVPLSEAPVKANRILSHDIS